MRRIINITLAAAGIFASVMASSPKTVAVGATTTEFHNVAIVYGLHVALPDDMRNFSPALIPLPSPDELRLLIFNPVGGRQGTYRPCSENVRFQG